MYRKSVKQFPSGWAVALAVCFIIAVLMAPFIYVRYAKAGRAIIFPVAGGGAFSNDFYAPRSNGIHGATDIFASKGTPLVAAVDGTITFAPVPQPSYGYMVTIRDTDGYQYNYIHINNDSPGTDDGNGGPMNAYAPDIKSGNRVVKGQHIGWLGDSGNAETTSPHLHFEIVEPNGQVANPYDSLLQAPRIPGPVIYPPLSGEILPFGAYFKGDINVAPGNFDTDPESEIITSAGTGGSAHVRVFDDNDEFTGVEFMAYDPRFPVGSDVAAGDVDGDGKDEIITGPGKGGGPHIRIFKTNAMLMAEFYAYSANFTGGVRVAAGDVDGDGKDEIITGPGEGGGPNVRIFKPNGTLFSSYNAYAPSFSGGIDVAAADVTGTASAEVMTAPGPGGGPHIQIFSLNGTVVDNFLAYDPQFTGGVRLSAGNIRVSTTKSEIATVPQTSGGPHMRLFNGDGSAFRGGMFMESWWYGYNDVMAGYNNQTKAATGTNRRAAIKQGI